MPTAWQRVFSGQNTAGTTLGSGTEVVDCTVSITDVTPDAPVLLVALASIAAGAGVTGLTPRIRRGGLTGTQIAGGSQIFATASVNSVIFSQIVDLPGDVAGQTYSFTVVSVGGGSTNLQALLFAVVG
jgi:hypothetical protein